MASENKLKTKHDNHRLLMTLTCAICKREYYGFCKKDLCKCSYEIQTDDVAGLEYIEDLLDPELQDKLFSYFSSPDRKWTNGPDNSSEGRQVQQYGYNYNYESRSVDHEPIEAIPNILVNLNKVLIEQKILSVMHNQVIINKYKPGQGITAHKDHIKHFGNEIASVSLGSGVSMEFVNKEINHRVSRYLNPGSIVVLRDDARYKYTHSILSRKKDNNRPRDIRISITYRTYLMN